MIDTLFVHKNSLSKHQRIKPGMEILLWDRLLWLRNHYDVGKPTLKDKVLADIDAVLEYVRAAE